MLQRSARTVARRESFAGSRRLPAPQPADPAVGLVDNITFMLQAEADAMNDELATTLDNPDVHIKDTFGCTPLHVAMLNGKPRSA